MSDSMIKWETGTVEKMISLYCRKNHVSEAGRLCPSCESLYNYSLERVNKCRFGEDKPRCSQCPVHCYKLSQRNKIREVMRFSGPRMIWYYPGRSVKYLWLKNRQGKNRILIHKN